MIPVFHKNIRSKNEAMEAVGALLRYLTVCPPDEIPEVLHIYKTVCFFWDLDERPKFWN
jgi:hypothetical protein